MGVASPGLFRRLRNEPKVLTGKNSEKLSLLFLHNMMKKEAEEWGVRGCFN